MNTIANPYIGPQPFKETERDRFFGRKREARDLLALVISEQLVLFYAQSGAGKSSLINTCLIPDLRAKRFEIFAGRVVGDVPPGVSIENVYVFNLLRSLAPGQTALDSLGKLTISEFLQEQRKEATTRHALIIDQFEEIFSTHQEAWEQREGFFQQLTQAMEDDPYLWVVLVMREDFIASLDPYAYLVPGRFRRRYYMQRLERGAALEAVKKPVENLRPYAEGVAEKLVRDLCSVKIYRPDGTLDVQPGQYVEPVQLQVICYNLWKNLPPGGTQITEKDVQDVGDVNTSLGNYYADRVRAVAEAKNVSERRIREWFTTKLISSAGIRTMVLQEHGLTSSGLENEVIRGLPDLIRAEQRGGSTFYELTHDRLVEPIIANNKKWEDEHYSALQRQAAIWRDQNENESWLLSDQALAEVEEWAKINPAELGEVEREFLAACRRLQAQIDERNQAHERQLETEKRSAQIARRITAVALGFLILAIFTTVYAFSQSNVAEQKRSEAVIAQSTAEAAEKKAKTLADISRAGELSALALGLADSKLDLAILLGIEANSLDSNTQTQNALLSLMQSAGRYLGTIKGDTNILDIQFVPNGKTFATLDTNGITFWDADTKKPLLDRPLNEHFGSVTALALSQDGKLMASGGSNGTIAIWDAATHQRLGEPFKAQDGEITSLALNPDGTMLAWATSENTIIRWDLIQGQQIEPPLEGHTDWITSLVFSPDGRTLASGSYDRTIILWDPTTGKPQGTIEGYSDWVTDLAFDGQVLASASDDYRVVFWDVSKPSKPVKRGEGSNGLFTYVRSIAISPETNIAASGLVDGSIVLWDISDISNPVSIGEPFNQDGGVELTDMAFTPRGNILASRTSEGSIILWDVQDPLIPQKVRTLSLEDVGLASDMVFGPEEEILVVGSYDSTITYWDITDPERPRKVYEPLQGHPSQPTGMKFSPDGRLLASYGDDGTLLFEVESQKLIGRGEIYESESRDIWLYTVLDEASGESTIHLQDAATGKAIGTAVPGQNPVISPDGRILAFETINQGTGRSQLHLRDITTARNIEDNLQGSYLTLNPDSQTLVYQSENADETAGRSIIFWDVPAATQLKTIPMDSPDDYTFVSEDGTVLALLEFDALNGRRTLNLLDTATGDPIIEPIEGADFGGLSANGEILFYYKYDESGNAQINVLNVRGGDLIGEATSGYIQAFYQSNELVAYSIFDNTKGNSVIRVIDTRTGQEISTTEGTLLNLIQQGEILLYEDNGIHLFDTDKQIEIADPIKGTYAGINPDGTTLVTRGENDSLVLWDLTNTWLLGQQTAGGSGDITSAALSPDGRILAFAGDAEITLQDPASGKPIDTISSEHLGGVSYVILSPDKQALLSVGEEGSAIAWDLRTAESSGEPILGTSAIFSPDGKLYAVGDGASPITIGNVTTGTQQALDEAPVGRPVIFSPDGKILAIEGEAGSILFDLASGHVIGDPIQGSILAGPATTDIFAVVDQTENTTTLWDWETKGHSGTPIAGSSSYFTWPRMNVLVVQNYATTTTTLWNATTGKQIGETLSGIYEPSLSPDGTLVSAADVDANTTYIWDLKTQNPAGSKQGYYRPIFCSDNSKAAFINDQDENITLVDKLGENPVEEIIAGNSLVFSPDCTKAVILKNSAPAHLWDIENGKRLAALGQGDNAVFSMDSSKVAIADSESNSTTFWNVSDAKRFGEEVPAGTLYFTPGYNDVLQLYDGVTDATTLWNLNTGTRIGDETYSWGYSPIFDADGRLISYNSKGVAVWDTRSTRMVEQPLHGHLAPISSLLFSPNGETLASLANDGIVLTDLDSGSSKRLENEDPASQLTAMAFRTDDTSMTTLGNDGKILIWDIASDPPALLHSLDVPYKDVLGSVYEPVLSPDGKYLIYEYDGTLSIWDIDREKAVQETNIEDPPVEAITLSPDGHSLFYTDDGKIFQWEGWTRAAAGSKPVEIISAGQNSISSLAVIMGDSTPQYLVVSSYSSLDQFGNPVNVNAQIWELARHSRLGSPLSGYKQTIGPYMQEQLLFYIDNDGRLIKANLDPFYLSGFLCNQARRNFTRAEWAQYFPPDEKYRRTCGGWPPETEAIGSQAP